VEIPRTVQERNLETYVSKFARPVRGQGTSDELVSDTLGTPRVLNPVLPEMLPPVPTFTPGTTGPKPIVTAGMLPTGGVTLLPLASFRTQTPASIIEPPPHTRGLLSATHITPSVPASLVVPPKPDVGTLGLTAVNVNTGTTACEAVCSVPITEVSATTKQTQVTTWSQAESSPAQLISTPATQAKLPEGPTPPTSGPSMTPVATSQLASAPVVSAPIVVVKQPQPTKPYTGQTSWKQYKEYFTRLALCNGWVTKVEKAQNLLVALEGAAAETVRGLTAEKDADYDAIWEKFVAMLRTHRSARTCETQV